MSVPNAEKLWLRAFKPQLSVILGEIGAVRNDNAKWCINQTCDLMEGSLPDLFARSGEIAVENITLIIREAREAVGHDHFRRAHDYLEGAVNLVYHGNIVIKDAAKNTVIQ